jgi:hypothetical protein
MIMGGSIKGARVNTALINVPSIEYVYLKSKLSFSHIMTAKYLHVTVIVIGIGHHDPKD